VTGERPVPHREPVSPDIPLEPDRFALRIPLLGAEFTTGNPERLHVRIREDDIPVFRSEFDIPLIEGHVFRLLAVYCRTEAVIHSAGQRPRRRLSNVLSDSITSCGYSPPRGGKIRHGLTADSPKIRIRSGARPEPDGSGQDGVSVRVLTPSSRETVGTSSTAEPSMVISTALSDPTVTVPEMSVPSISAL
jgi:hypothetical protein